MADVNAAFIRVGFGSYVSVICQLKVIGHRMQGASLAPFLLLPFILLACATTEPKHLQLSVMLFDSSRGREIPVEMYFPKEIRMRGENGPLPVAFISPGYGGSHKGYSFIARALNDMECVVVSVQHDLPTDEPIAREGDLYTLRMPAWRRGEENLRFVRATLADRYPQYDWNRLILIGHSNGGDISALFAKNQPSLVSALITLDHRRMPLPRTSSPRVLSIRASDVEADSGVLPTPEEQRTFGMSIVKLKGAKHNDMDDDGSSELKREILETVRRFLTSETD